MTTDHEDLVTRLELGPAYLLLGQKYLLMESGEDPLVGPVCRATGTPSDTSSIYRLLPTVPSKQRETVLSALAEAAATLAEPAWLRVVAGLPWNGVFSTAVDSLFVRALRNEWRAVQPVASASFRPSSPRSVSQVQAVLLFGGVDQPPEHQPPTSRLELAARRAEARALAQRLPDELITPRGVLIIEAWDLDDWFNSEDLYGVLYRLGPAQAHLFSATATHLEDDYIAAAIAKGVLVAHTEDFATYVEEAKDGGRLAVRQQYHAGGHRIRHGREMCEVPRDIWNSVASFGQPIDDELLATPPVHSEELRYLRFREFLGASESPSIWSAIGSKLAFRRDFEKELHERVNAALSGRGLLQQPLLLVGQTGTGKTIALASLAYSVAQDGHYAVLHIPRRAIRPSFKAIDSFCEWAEAASIPATLLVWDGMTDPDEYFRLVKYLDSRGRRVTVVGSCYRTNNLRTSNVVVEAHASLRAKEMQRLVDHLASLGIIILDRDKSLIQKDSTFLSALYRLLPESRGPISHGLVLELRHTETALNLAVHEGVEYKPPTAMAAALHKVGLLDNLEAVLSEVEGGDEVSSYRGPYERLVYIVLVASRHGQPIPLDLALRVVGRDGVRNLPQLLGKIDLIRWIDDGDGNYSLSARNELEAKVLINAENMSDETEMEAIAEALSMVRPDRTIFGGGEVKFVVDLLNRIGPQGDQEERYAPHYLRIADAIAHANGAAVRPNPRLALLETNLCREWVKYAQRKQIADASKRADILRRAEEIVEEALAELLSPSSPVRANLMVEQASVVGAQIYELLHSGPDGGVPAPAPVTQISDLVSRVLRITSDSMASATDKYYPVDVLCWVTIAVLENHVLPEHDAANLLAQCFSRLLLIEVPDLSPKQEATYNARFADLARLADDEKLADQKLQELAEQDEPLAAYLYALRISGLIRNVTNSDGIRIALTYLQSRPAAMDDPRCLRLLVDLFWMAKTGYRFMGGERLTLPLNSSDWTECLGLADRLKAMDELSVLRVEFMRALALFHLGRLASAFQAFRDAERQSHTFRRRIVNVYLASDSSGSPRRFHPVVRRVDPDQRKGMCWVEELVGEIPFQPYDFDISDPPPGLALPEAYVAFNLRGPILEPARNPGDRRGPNVISSLGASTDAETGRNPLP